MDLKSELRKLIYGTTVLPTYLDISTLTPQKRIMWLRAVKGSPIPKYNPDYVKLVKVNPDVVWPSTVWDKETENYRNSIIYSAQNVTIQSVNVLLGYVLAKLNSNLESTAWILSPVGSSIQTGSISVYVDSLKTELSLDFGLLGIRPQDFTIIYEDATFLYNGWSKKYISKLDRTNLSTLIQNRMNEINDLVTIYGVPASPRVVSGSYYYDFAPTQKYKDRLIAKAKALLTKYLPIVPSELYTSEFDALVKFVATAEQIGIPVGVVDLGNYPVSKITTKIGSSYDSTGKLVDTFNTVSVYDNSLITFLNAEFADLATSLNYRQTFAQNLKASFYYFNFLISIRDHYNLYQSTAFLFSSTAMKEKISNIIGRNFLKLLESQLPLLVPNGINARTDVEKFIQLTTMGYLKQGDIVTTSLIPYFKVDDEITGIMNRISVISTVVNGNKVIPTFITNIVGTDVTPTSMPTGKMVVKLINDVLIEADKVFTWMGY